MCCFQGASEWNELPVKLICAHLIHLLMGIPSSTFTWHEVIMKDFSCVENFQTNILHDFRADLNASWEFVSMELPLKTSSNYQKISLNVETKSKGD